MTADVLPASEKPVDFWKVFFLTIPVATAYLPLGIAFGIFLTSSHIAWYWAPISAFMIFAGSIEFLAVTFLLAGFPLYLTAWTTFIINFRHVFYGLSFPYTRLKSKFQKIYGIWALTDETYAITTVGNGRALNGREITFLQLISHFWWVGGAAAGALFGLLIPPTIKGFDFALTAMFVLLAVDALKESKDWKLLGYVGVSAFCGLLSEHLLLPESYLAVSLIVYLCCILGEFKRGKHAQ